MVAFTIVPIFMVAYYSLTAEGAGHGEAMYVLGDAYWESVFSFLGQYM